MRHLDKELIKNSGLSKKAATALVSWMEKVEALFPAFNAHLAMDHGDSGVADTVNTIDTADIPDVDGSTST